MSDAIPGPRSLFHGDHLYEPGIDVDDPDQRDPRWCNTCGEVVREPLPPAPVSAVAGPEPDEGRVVVRMVESPSGREVIDADACALGGELIGLVLTGDDDGRVEFRPYLLVRGEGDAEPTLFCEDCASWLETVAPSLAAPAAAGREPDEGRCAVCGGPLSDARRELGLTVCSGPCFRARQAQVLPLSRLRELSDAATPSPWFSAFIVGRHPVTAEDAELTAAAVNYVRTLLATSASGETREGPQ